MAYLRCGLLACTLGLAISSLSIVRADEPKRPVLAPVAAAAKVSGSGAQKTEKSIVAVQHGRLTVRIKNGSLEWLLDRVSEQSGIAFVAPKGMGTERLSLNLQNLPLEEALRQILSNHDSFFVWAAGQQPGKPASLKAVWVYPNGKGRNLQPLSPEEWASTKELREKLSDRDAEVRATALKSLIERNGKRAQEDVLQALRDTDAKVRSRALFYAQDRGVPLPASILKNLAASDSSAEVRFLALQGLDGDPDLKDIAQQALSDPDPHVREGARELLDNLKATESLPNGPAQGSPREQPAHPDPQG